MQATIGLGLRQIGGQLLRGSAAVRPACVARYSTEPAPEEDLDSDQAFKESETYANLRDVFVNEVQAHRRYLYSAEIADQAGDMDVARTFRDAAESEARHATLVLDILAEVSDPVTDLPLNDSADCLRSAIDSETLDVNDYTGFAKTAREEGYDSVAEYLEEVVAADRKHQQKFQRVLDELESDQ